jgi:hypothetical protein
MHRLYDTCKLSFIEYIATSYANRRKLWKFKARRGHLLKAYFNFHRKHYHLRAGRTMTVLPTQFLTAGVSKEMNRSKGSQVN